MLCVVLTWGTVGYTACEVWFWYLGKGNRHAKIARRPSVFNARSISPRTLLRLHRRLGGQQDLAPVAVGPEQGALLCDLEDGGLLRPVPVCPGLHVELVEDGAVREGEDLGVGVVKERERVVGGVNAV